MNTTIADRVRAWTFDQALPFWSAHGLDLERGGYVESLNMDGTRSSADYKRVRVLCRQIYVFSHASIMGWSAGTELARHGFQFLITHGWLGDTRGWARTLNADGTIRDATADLYDNAFALFALSWYYRASGDPAAQVWAMQTVKFITDHLRHPTGIGFMHWKPLTGHRQQNPHMHLLEACLASFEAMPDERTAKVSVEIAGLFQSHFFDADSRTLGEFFDDDWSRAKNLDGQMIEPGHQFEWAWILVNLKRLLGLDLADHARALVGFGEEFGINTATKATYDGVWDTGRLRDGKSRVWPNTERIKAAVAMYELDGKNPALVFDQSAGLLLDRYLAMTPQGCWVDQLDEAGSAISKTIPSSTLYHIFLAFSELLRVSDA